ncbi:hypothetical protein ACKAXM_003969 [Escherichia coli]
MNGFRNSSRNGQVWRYQSAGSRAVILEAAEAWRRAAGEGCNEKAAFITPGIQKAE